MNVVFHSISKDLLVLIKSIVYEAILILTVPIETKKTKWCRNTSSMKDRPKSCMSLSKGAWHIGVNTIEGYNCDTKHCNILSIANKNEWDGNHYNWVPTNCKDNVRCEWQKAYSKCWIRTSSYKSNPISTTLCLHDTLDSTTHSCATNLFSPKLLLLYDYAIWYCDISNLRFVILRGS